jgi:adenosylcobyric acid synthase
MFENPAVMRALFGAQTPTLDDTLDGLADFIEAHIPERTLVSLLDADPV